VIFEVVLVRNGAVNSFDLRSSSFLIDLKVNVQTIYISLVHWLAGSDFRGYFGS
jgi:hypothetical protein